ncbi:hypothetical protein D3C73_1305580 [compost metagenome]
MRLNPLFKRLPNFICIFNVCNVRITKHNKPEQHDQSLNNQKNGVIARNHLIYFSNKLQMLSLFAQSNNAPQSFFQIKDNVV